MTKPETPNEQVTKIRNDAIETAASAENFLSVTVTDAPQEAYENDEEKKEENSGPPSKKAKDSSPKKYQPKYKKEWESNPELKAWLSESIYGNTYFYCKFCKKDYRCSISDIHKHMSSKKHLARAAAPAYKAQKFKFRGLLCPVFTPFGNVRSITPVLNLYAIEKYANFLNACNVRGILINDIMGEGMSLTIKERIQTTDTWAEVCEKNEQFLMVQIGGAPFKDVIELAKHASKRDVGAVVILPDLYSKPRNHLDLIKYIKMISDFTRNVPILYHHNPKFTQVEVDIPSLLVDIIDEVDSFAGLICTSNDIQQSLAAMSVNPDRYTIFVGTDEAILAAAACGFSCIMSSSLNFLPKLVESIFEDVKKSNVKNAQASQNLLNRTLDMVSKQGDVIAVFKAATDIMTNTCGITTRAPLQTLWEGTVKKIQENLRLLGVM